MPRFVRLLALKARATDAHRTWAYVRRQRTWFRSEPAIDWLEAAPPGLCLIGTGGSTMRGNLYDVWEKHGARIVCELPRRSPRSKQVDFRQGERDQDRKQQPPEMRAVPGGA